MGKSMLERSLASFLAALLVVGLSGCSSSEPAEGPQPQDPETVGSGPPLPEPDLPTPEDPAQRNRRLRHLEQALDNWYIASESQEYARKASLEHLLLEYTKENMDDIVSDLKHGSPRHRRVVAAALGFSSSPAAVAPLTAALTDTNFDVVQHALLSLYHLTKPEPLTPITPGADVQHRFEAKGEVLERVAVDPNLVDSELVASFLQHHLPEIRSNAALALRPLVQPGQVPNSVFLGLLNACEDNDDRTRVHAVAALGATRSKDAVPHLVKALSDRKALVRIRAALALGLVGDKQIAPYLIEVLGRPDEQTEVKRFVARSLTTLLDAEETASLSTDPEYWEGVAAKKGVDLGR
jgi:HEAT repeat protein